MLLMNNTQVGKRIEGGRVSRNLSSLPSHWLRVVLIAQAEARHSRTSCVPINTPLALPTHRTGSRVTSGITAARRRFQVVTKSTLFHKVLKCFDWQSVSSESRPWGIVIGVKGTYGGGARAGQSLESRYTRLCTAAVLCLRLASAPSTEDVPH